MNEGKAAIYEYIKDQHDKHVAHRESLASRFGNIRLTAGLILTIVSFSLGIVVQSVEKAHGRLALTVAVVPLAFFAIALYFVTRSLLNVPDLVGTIHVHFPKVEKEKLNKFLELIEVDADRVIRALSQNYLAAIEINREAKWIAGQQLERCVRFIRWALFATIAFLISALTCTIFEGWLVKS
jgi:hypothetical protein